jgi:hypothetical protein
MIIVTRVSLLINSSDKFILNSNELRRYSFETEKISSQHLIIFITKVQSLFIRVTVRDVRKQESLKVEGKDK